MSAVHGVKAGPSIRGYVLRALLTLIVLGAALALIEPTWLRIAAVALGLTAAVFPHSLCAWATMALLAFGMLLAEPSPWAAGIAVLAVHTIHLLGSLTLAIPALARVQLRALGPAAFRFLWIQAVSQAVAFAAMLLLQPPGGIGFAWLAPAGAATLLGLLALLRLPESPLARR